MTSTERKAKILAECRRVIAAGGRICQRSETVTAECCCPLAATAWPPAPRARQRSYLAIAREDLGVSTEWAEAFAAAFDTDPSHFATVFLRRWQPVAYRMGQEIFEELGGAALVAA